MKKINQRGFTAVEALLIVIVLVLLGGAGWYVYTKHHKQITNKSVSTTKSTAQVQSLQKVSDICFIESATLKCADSEGQNITTHALPTLGGRTATALVPNDTDTQYLGSTGGEWWLLGKNLNVIKQLSFPDGLTYNSSDAVSWSHDGKYLFIELDGANNDRQIYKYTLATGEAVRLTSQGSNSSPYQTQDGHILYTHFSDDAASPSGWMPYIMDADGSDARALTTLSNPALIPDSDATEFAGLSYDAATDTVFVDNFGNTSEVGSGSLSYETVQDLLNGVAPKTINLNVEDSGDGSLLGIGGTSILWQDSISPNESIGQIINLGNGKVESTIAQYNGNPVGVLSNPGNLK